MKGKDIKAGMIVAVGSPTSRYREHTRAMVVLDGATYFAGRDWNSSYTRKVDKIGVALATRGRDGRWYPKVVPPSNILMTWAEFEKQEAVRAERQKQHDLRVKQDRIEKEKRQALNKKKHAVIGDMMRELGLEYKPRMLIKMEDDNVEIPVDTMIDLLLLTTQARE